MSIHNMAELEAQMNRVMDSLMNSLSIKLLKMLQDKIREDVYENDYFPNDYYADGSGLPSANFLEAWEWDNIERSLRSRVKELFYNWSTMESDREPYGIHSDIFGKDVSKYLMDMLNVDGMTSPIGVKERKPYWDNYIADLDKHFTNIAYEQLKQLGKRYGFTVKKA